MNNSQANPLLNTVEKIFSNVESPQKNPQFKVHKTKAVPKQQLELALTVLLVDLAACDDKFQPEEYHLIANGLRRLFGTTRHQVQALVNQATQVLRNLRGTSNFAALLKENLSDEERLAIMEIIDELIHSDGVVDGFEVYLRHKLTDLLGINEIIKNSNNLE